MESFFVKPQALETDAHPAPSTAKETASASASASSSQEALQNLPFPPPIERSTLQYRLETGNIAKQGGQRGSITRCAQKLGAFQQQLTSSSPDAERIETAKQELAQDLEFFHLELLKMILLQRNLDNQVEQNLKADQERKHEIEEWSKEVNTSRLHAKQAEETKRCLEEYEAIAKMTNNNLPSSSQKLKSQIGAIQNEVEDLKAEESITNHTLKVREGQFQLLIQYMTDLKRSLNDSEEEEKLLELAKKQSTKNEDLDGKSDQRVMMDVDEDENEEGLYSDLV